MACARSSSPCTHDGIDFYTFHAFLQCTLHEACAYDSVTVRVNKKTQVIFISFKKNLRDLSFVYCCKKVQVHCGPTWYRPCFPPHGCIGPRICTPKHCEIVENVSNSEKLGRKGDKVKCTLPE